MSTLKTTNLQHASAASPAIVLASDGSATAQLSSVNGGPLAGSRNRIINGDMRIDQRNAGASVTVTSGVNVLDRWAAFAIGGGAVGIQQDSTIALAGFTHALKAVVSTPDASLASTDEVGINQAIEGYNVADLNFGKASAITITVSFWVYSTIAGSYGFALKNAGITRSYPTSYTINSANTWEYKTITIPGDTTGTWQTTNGRGLEVYFSLGCGSSLKTTGNAWTAGNFSSATGTTNLISTNGAVFYLTGVQVEPGATATPFERRSYGQELALCQRYYQKSYDASQGIGVLNDENNASIQIATSTTRASSFVRFGVEMRTDPTMTAYSTSGTLGGISGVNSLVTTTTGVTFSANHYSPNGFQEISTPGSLTAGSHYQMHWTASAEL